MDLALSPSVSISSKGLWYLLCFSVVPYQKCLGYKLRDEFSNSQGCTFNILLPLKAAAKFLIRSRTGFQTMAQTISYMGKFHVGHQQVHKTLLWSFLWVASSRTVIDEDGVCLLMDLARALVPTHIVEGLSFCIISRASGLLSAPWQHGYIEDILPLVLLPVPYSRTSPWW